MSSLPAKVMRDGLLEKRSSGLLQLWKKKRCVLTEDGLRLHTCRRNGNGNGNSNGNGGGNGNGNCGNGNGGSGNDAPCSAFGAKAKDLRFERMATVDCVEYKRGLVYFTVVMATGKEIDFRCAQDGTAWNAEIALALVRYKNLQAVQTGKNRHLSSSSSSHIGEEEEAL
ncbi:hypothetical protein CRUP_008797 [Coryphaenoides rupestris]|nr:hypothetical protein CRUP_008797 [Coryphaenoides rupestris]